MQWGYWHCPLETSSACFGPFQSVVEAWRAKWPAADQLPAREDFDFPDFRGWWGRVAIARVYDAPFAVEYVLWGTTLSEWWDFDYSNRTLPREAQDPAFWTASEGRYFQAMRRAPFIGVAAGDLARPDRAHRRVLSVDLPLGDRQGLTHVLAYHRALERDQTIADLLPDCPLNAMPVT